MVIRAISDLHGSLPLVEPCDLLLIAGDVSPKVNRDAARQRQWLDTCFLDWLQGPRCQARKVVWVAGNHDLALGEQPPSQGLQEAAIYLQDSSTEIEGLRIYGMPWSKIVKGEWTFEVPEHDDEGLDLETMYSQIPEGTDIVIVHGPPRGFGDRVFIPETQEIENCGSPALLKRLEEVKPRLVVFGHVHEDAGQWQHQGMTLANVAQWDLKYKATREPQQFQL